MNKFDLEERLVDFAVLAINLSKQVPNNAAGSHLGGQLIRSATSPALNYGEAQSAKSRRDFIHKMKIALKELRESHICIKIIRKAGLLNDLELLESGINESNELISIFVKSTKTAQQNRIKE